MLYKQELEEKRNREDIDIFLSSRMSPGLEKNGSLESQDPTLLFVERGMNNNDDPHVLWVFFQVFFDLPFPAFPTSTVYLSLLWWSVHLISWFYLSTLCFSFLIFFVKFVCDLQILIESSIFFLCFHLYKFIETQSALMLFFFLVNIWILSIIT